MGFVAPLVLLGLGALAVPVFVHLIQRERKRVVEFPSLMFLRRIPYQSVRRRRIRDWLLLAMRLAALALIVLAFARPFFRRDSLAAAAQNGAREAVILVDTSYSMDYGDRWTKAQAAARDAVNALNPGDRASLVFFSSGADVAVRSAGDKGRLVAAIAGRQGRRRRDALCAGAETRRQPAQRVAAAAPRDPSDQRLPAARLGTDAGPRRRQAARSHDADAGQRRLGPDRQSFGDRGVAAAHAIREPRPRRRHRRSRQPWHEAGVERRAHARSRRPVDPVAAGERRAGRFVERHVRPLHRRLAQHAGAGQAPRADALARDNVFNFVVSPSEPVRAIVINRPGADGEALYLTRALAIGEAPRVELASRTPATFSDADARAAAVVVLNDVQVSDDLADRLGRFVSAGGGLLIAAGPHATWPAHAAASVPALPGDAIDRTTTPASRLGGLEYSHPVFELFRAPRSGDFSAARFYGYRATTQPAPGQVLARFDDGTAALLERKTGAGRVLLWTSTLDLEWNDLRGQTGVSAFHPHDDEIPGGLRRRACIIDRGPGDPGAAPRRGPRRHGLERRYRRGGAVGRTGVGRDRGRRARAGRTGVLRRPHAGRRRRLGDRARQQRRFERIGSDADGSAGPAGRGRAGRPASAAGVGEARPSDEAQAQAQRLWWYLLVAGGLLLAAETLLSNRLSTQNGARLS